MNKRLSNFELLRIICMMMIIGLHSLGHGGILENTRVGSLNFFLAHLLESASIIAVNCYILISGYFGIHSKFKIKKLLSLYFQMFFYSLIITGIFIGLRIEGFSIQALVYLFFPFSSQLWWFMSVFLILYLCTPFINKFLHALSKRELSILLILFILIFVVWPSVPIFEPIDNKGGYSLYYFIVLYSIGAAVRLFYENVTLSKKKLAILYLLCSLLLASTNVVLSLLMGRNFGIYSYNFILIFISSVTFFLLFKEFRFNLRSRFINWLSSLTLGIYLIHDHIYVRRFVYQYFNVQDFGTLNPFLFLAKFFLFVLSVFVLSALVESLRQLLFNKLEGIQNKRFEKFCKKVDDLMGSIK